MLQPNVSTMCWDPQQQAVVLSSDGADLGPLHYGRDMWTLRNGQWTWLRPALAQVEQMTFDSARSRLVALQGHGFASAQLQEWNGLNWSAVSFPTSLYFCRQHGICFDPTRNKTLVFGWNPSVPGCVLWAYDGTGWQQLGGVATGPEWGSFRLMPTTTGDVLWLGNRWSTARNEAWRWSAGAWTQLTNPPSTLGADFAQDPTTLQPFLIGAAAGSTAESVWAFTGSNWNLVGSGGPGLMAAFSATHDGQGLVLFGGWLTTTQGSHTDGQTWVFRNGTFHKLVESSPQNLASRRAVWDSARGRTLIVGWLANVRQTWEWNGANFSLRHSAPGAVSADGLAFDELRARAVLLGSDGSTEEWNGASWTTVGGAGFGPRRPNAGMAFDGQRVVLFGGFDPSVFQVWNQTWLYDGVSWTAAAPATPPPASASSAQLVFDPRRGRTVLFASALSTVYEWNGANWANTGALPWAAPRTNMFAGYHPARGRVLVGGGLNSGGGGLADVWEWNGTSFTGQPPHFAVGATLAPEPGGDAMLYGSENWGPSPIVERIASTSPATVSSFGDGCPGSVGVPAIGADPWAGPWLGDVMRVRCTQLPPATSAVFWGLGFSNTSNNGVPLPLDLLPQGAPGCWLRISIEQVMLGAVVAGASTLDIPVPANTQLLGLRGYLQALVIDAAANPGGFVVTNAVAATVGSR